MLSSHVDMDSQQSSIANVCVRGSGASVDAVEVLVVGMVQGR